MYRRHILNISVLSATFVVIPLAGQSAYAAECGAEAEEIQAELLKELNRIRSSDTQCGNRTLPAAQPLVWNDTLADVARSHSDDMASNNFFEYTGSDGIYFIDRIRQAGYQPTSPASVKGSIGAGRQNVAEFLEQTLDSPGTCAVLVSDSEEDVGAACIEAPEDSDYDTYWTLFLGKQSSVGSAVSSVATANDGKVPLVSESNDLCIDVPFSDFSDGKRPFMFPCNGSDAQQWSLKNGRVETSNGMCMDAAGGGTVNDTPIQIASCSDNPAQQFTLSAEGDLINEPSGKCVDILDFNEQPGAQLILFNCQGTSNQKWVQND